MTFVPDESCAFTIRRNRGAQQLVLVAVARELVRGYGVAMRTLYDDAGAIGRASGAVNRRRAAAVYGLTALVARKVFGLLDHVYLLSRNGVEPFVIRSATKEGSFSSRLGAGTGSQRARRRRVASHELLIAGELLHSAVRSSPATSRTWDRRSRRRRWCDAAYSHDAN